MTDRYRSLLFVPGSNERMIDKAAGLTADLVIFDLEDAVAPEHKQTARSVVARTLAEARWKKRSTGVRINPVGRGALRDLLSVAAEPPDVVVLPKVECASDLAFAAMALREFDLDRGYESGTMIIALLETPRGVANAARILEGADRLCGVGFGSGDYTSLAGITESDDRAELLVPRAHVSMAAASVGVAAYDAVYYRDLSDLEALSQDTAFGRALGYSGKFAVHPAQLDVINALYAPQPSEVAWARKVLEAAAAHGAPRGALRVDGQMVDAPILARARRILEVVT